MEKEYQWIIWSIEHNGWWAPNRRGYTPSRRLAGRYSFEEACEIVRSANAYRRENDLPFETMVRDEEEEV